MKKTFLLVLCAFTGSSAFAAGFNGHWVTTGPTAPVTCQNGYSAECPFTADFMMTEDFQRISTTGNISNLVCEGVAMSQVGALHALIKGNQLTSIVRANVVMGTVGLVQLLLDPNKMGSISDEQANAPLDQRLSLTFTNGMDLLFSEDFEHLGVKCSVTTTLKSTFP
jgi:hypothetical protein